MARRIEQVIAGVLFLVFYVTLLVFFVTYPTRAEAEIPPGDRVLAALTFVLLLGVTTGWGRLMVPLFCDVVILVSMLCALGTVAFVLLTQAREETRFLPFLLDIVIFVSFALMIGAYARLIMHEVRCRRSAASRGVPH